jgi:hypothetical protein
MLKIVAPVLGAMLIAASGALYAQAPQSDSSAQKQERREKMRTAKDKASKACEGKAEGERRDCMRREMCAQSKDPAKCEARAKEAAERRSARRAQIHEACKDKQGDELKSCVREQRRSRKSQSQKK